MMIVVVVTFAVCWLPYHLYFVLAATKPEINNWKHMQNVYNVIYWMAMSNSMYNPIIYCWMNSRFRHGFVKLFCCCPCRLCAKFKDRSKPETVDTAIYDTLVKKEGVKRVHFGNIPIVTLSAR